MRLRFLLSVLFFSASPSFADEYLYLKCNFLTIGKATHKETGYVYEGKPVNKVAMLKIDLANHKIATPQELDEWKTVEIDDGRVQWNESRDFGTILVITDQYQIMIDPIGSFNHSAQSKHEMVLFQPNIIQMEIARRSTLQLTREL